MPEMIRHVILNLVGLSLVTFGAFATVSHYPSPGQLAIWSNALPALTAMLIFSLCIAAIIVGVALLIPMLWRLRRSPRRRTAFSSINPYDRVPPPRSVPVRDERDDELDPDGRGYFEDDGDRYRGNGEYREFDDRRRASAFR